MKQNSRIRLLSFLVIGYMLLAFTWWSVLLFTKNRDAFGAKAELLRIGLAAQDLYINEENFQQTSVYRQLEKDYSRQEWMILGEGMAFSITLLIGLYLINRGYNREMQAARQRRNFLLSITHELKSPIASIRLVLETLNKRKLEEPQKEKLLRSGLQENERLHRLVNDLLLSAKLEATYQPIFTELDLVSLLQELIEQVGQKFPDASIQTSLPSKLRIQGDATGMRSLLLNLLENALKYSDPPADIQIIGELDAGNILLEIADKGHGIPDREKNKVFEKFYRVGNEDTRKTKGTGLGLYIVKEIVTAHGGKIQILNNKPKGTVFKITLPNSNV